MKSSPIYRLKPKFLQLHNISLNAFNLIRREFHYPTSRRHDGKQQQKRLNSLCGYKKAFVIYFIFINHTAAAEPDASVSLILCVNNKALAYDYYLIVIRSYAHESYYASVLYVRIIFFSRATPQVHES